MLIVALLACWWFTRRRAVASGIDVSHVDLAVPLVFAISLLGAELLTTINPRDTEFAGEVLGSQSRFRLFGLLLVGVPALYAYSRVAKLSFRKLLDLCALPVLLWLALVRVGCFMAGCCWGDLVHEHTGLTAIAEPGMGEQILTLPWFSSDRFPVAVSFPAGSLAYQQHLALGLLEPASLSSLTVHPTQLYELFLLAVLLLVLKWKEGRVMPVGLLAIVALGSYALLRFFIEYLRADNALVLGNLTLNQLICIALLLVCIALIPALKRMADH
jgi:phosphatidylglycerol:prolipoprotein diacylglycerol transferase